MCDVCLTKEILVGSDNKLGDEFVGQRVEVGTIESRFGTTPQICIYHEVSRHIIPTLGNEQEHTVVIHMITYFLHGITHGWVGADGRMVL